ncbi:MAG: hypothetical protein M4579_006387 [Chaenotheca gracillima]|nr:MAG: hypothetical protein M4579_006387 [Chaenotheca gracillima]
MPRPPPRVPSGPEKQVECLTCMADDIPISKSAKLTCGHIMCHDCLKRIFELSITDPQHMPPKCCTPDHIPLKHVDKLFSDKFKQRWNRKYQEFTTKNRIYCPNRGCGDWIKPSHIHRDERGRKYAKCSHCKTKVCTMCNGKWHIKKDCPKDEETNRFVEFAKREGWQRCHSCSAMVELKEGCNHMTCRCTAEFCMICGAKWKTCDCPWFNQPQVMAHERLMNFNVPVQVQYPFRVVRHQQQPLPYNGARAPANAAPQPRGYNEELERRRRQEQRDEAIARRLQVLGMDDDDDFVRGGGPADFYGVGNGQGHLMNENYVRLAGDILDGAFNQARAGMGEGNRRAAGPTRDRPLDPFLYEVLEPAARVQQARQPLPDREDNTPLRLHTVASRTYNAAPGTRPAERVVPRRTRTDYATEFARHMPVAQRNEPARAVPRATNAPRPANDARRHSLMAGLVGSNRAEGGRVGAWLRHVEDGLPPAEEGRAPV